MKGYKKLMDFVALVEKAVLAATMIMILVLTVGNVFSRKVIHQSWYGQGIGTACQPETNLRIKLAGMDLLVLRTHWFRVHGPALY